MLSYFSGCLTLTIDKIENVKKRDYIVVNGLKKEEIEFIKSKTNREIIEFKQDVKRGTFSEETWEKRKKRVEDTLKLYQGAHMVITTKLHCSLPCLAINEPVLLLYDDSCKENEDRIGSFLPYLNYINRKEFILSNINFEEPKKNKNNHLELRNELIKKCKQFIEDLKKCEETDLPEITKYKLIKEDERDARNVVIKYIQLLQKEYKNLKEEYKNLKEENIIYENRIQDLKNHIEFLNNEYSKLENAYNLVINSKGWKILEKLRKFKSKNT